MKTNLLYFFLFLLNSLICAQTRVTESHQGFRVGDIICKQQVEFKDPGRTGTDVLWDFSELKPINAKYKVRYYRPLNSENGDSSLITCLEHKTLYKYKLKGDSLLLLGYENSGSRLAYSPPQYVLKYPFSIGDSISNFFVGEGSYEHTLSTTTSGRITVVADATGTLILPEGDTIYDAIRVRSLQNYLQKTNMLVNKRHGGAQAQMDSTLHAQSSSISKVQSDSVPMMQNSENNIQSNLNIKSMISKKIPTKNEKIHSGLDSLGIFTETCRWYAPGYRYPLFETVRNYGRKTMQDTSQVNDFSTAFYYPPSLQSFLENDPGNKFVLDSLKEARTHLIASANTLLFKYNLYPNPVRTDLNVELLLDFPSRVTLTISTMSGVPVIRKDMGSFFSGSHNFILPLSQLQARYYILNIQVSNQIVEVVILKQ